MLKVPVDDTVHSHRINSPSRHSGLCVSPLFKDPTSTAPLTTQVPQPLHPQPLALLTPVCTFPSQATPSSPQFFLFLICSTPHRSVPGASKPTPTPNRATHSLIGSSPHRSGPGAQPQRSHLTTHTYVHLPLPSHSLNRNTPHRSVPGASKHPPPVLTAPPTPSLAAPLTAQVQVRQQRQVLKQLQGAPSQRLAAPHVQKCEAVAQV